MRSLFAFLFGIAVAVNGFSVTVPKDITKTVVFIYTNQDGAPAHAYGTGFLISVPVRDHPGRVWLYLVTAQHVLHTNGNDLKSPWYQRLYLRINMRDGSSTMAHFDIRPDGDNPTVLLDADTTVDVAVVPMNIPDDKQVDVLAFPESMLVRQADFQQYHIGVGCDMFFTGMFYPYQGQKRNDPIVRFGKLAMIPEEKISFANTLMDAYLVETFSFGGNSGSPVFFYPSADNTPGVLMVGPSPIKIAGVMRGYFSGDFQPIQMAQAASTVQGQAIPVSESNSGIAVIVPAEHIREILDAETNTHLRPPAP